MDRRTRNLFVLALVALLAVTGGAALLFNSGAFDGTGSETVEGVIVSVDSEGLDRVRGFSIRTADGQTIEFVLGTLERGAEFPPGHLAEHQATAEPVRVTYVTEGATRVAVRIDDALTP